MIYGLLIIGVVISIYGWRLIKEEDSENIGMKVDDSIKSQLATIEDKLDILLCGETNHMKVPAEQDMTMDVADNEKDYGQNYSEVANKIKIMSRENKSVEEMAQALNIGKGEVLLLKRLLIR